MAKKCEHCGSVVCDYCGRNDCHGKTECLEAKVRRLEQEVNDLKNRQPTVIINQPYPVRPLESIQPWVKYRDPWDRGQIWITTKTNTNTFPSDYPFKFYGATSGNQIDNSVMSLLGNSERS